MTNPLYLPLHLDGVIVMEMVEHALRDHPIEACGMVVGPRIGKPLSYWPMRNILASPTAFAFDPDEYLRACSQMDRLGWDPLAIFHSHTVEPAEPSEYDEAVSFETDRAYVIVSTVDEEPVMRAWRRVGDGLTEVSIEVG